LAGSIEWELRLGEDELVVDIGANDGTLLRNFRCRTVAVEPTNQVQKVTGPAYHEFFSKALAEQIIVEWGTASVVTACNVLAHVEDIHDALEGIRVLLGEDGTLVAENHDLGSIVDGGQWDTIYHEHVRFFDPFSFAELLKQHGLYVWQVKPVDTHGGSFRAYVHTSWSGSRSQARRDYDFAGLRDRAAKARHHLRADLSARRHGGDRIAAVGATARASTIIGYCGLSSEDISCVYEVPGSDKIGWFMPGTTIPVVSEQGLMEDRPDVLVLFSWHLAGLLVPKLRDELGYAGTIVVPLPKLRNLRPRSTER
jgi:hypothetical protein